MKFPFSALVACLLIPSLAAGPSFASGWMAQPLPTTLSGVESLFPQQALASPVQAFIRPLFPAWDAFRPEREWAQASRSRAQTVALQGGSLILDFAFLLVDTSDRKPAFVNDSYDGGILLGIIGAIIGVVAFLFAVGFWDYLKNWTSFLVNRGPGRSALPEVFLPMAPPGVKSVQAPIYIDEKTFLQPLQIEMYDGLTGLGHTKPYTGKVLFYRGTLGSFFDPKAEGYVMQLLKAQRLYADRQMKGYQYELGHFRDEFILLLRQPHVNGGVPDVLVTSKGYVSLAGRDSARLNYDSKEDVFQISTFRAATPGELARRLVGASLSADTLWIDPYGNIEIKSTPLAVEIPLPNVAHPTPSIVEGSA